jgi:lysophospholipase L1-like esterase
VPVFSGHQVVGKWLEARGDSVHVVSESSEMVIRVFPTQPQSPRIAVLGGSSVHGGSHLKASAEFPGLIEQATRITTLNLGKPANDSHDVVKILEELLAWPLDAAVVYTGHNDFGNLFFNDRFGGLSQGRQAHAQAFLERFQLFNVLKRSLQPEVQGAQNIDANPNETDENLAAIGTSQRAAALRYYAINLQRMAWLTRRAGVPLILVTPVGNVGAAPTSASCIFVPCAGKLHQEAMFQLNSDREQALKLLRHARDVDPIPLRAPRAAVEAVRAFGGEPGVTVVDAVALLPTDPRYQAPSKHLFADPVHFSAEGHRAMAALLSPIVAEVVHSDR